MLSKPAISESEIRSVQDCVANDIRCDGRTLTQRRPFTVTSKYGATGNVSMSADYDGSRVEVQCGGTIVVAAATPSVVEVQGNGSGAAAERGLLFVSIDAVPAVVDYYAQALRNRGGRYRHAFLSFLAASIRYTFGAEGVAVEEQQFGLVEAELVPEDDAVVTENAVYDGGDVGGRLRRDEHHASDGVAGGGDGNSGFPGDQLYIGSGYAFRVDVDVHVLQACGGNLPSVVSIAVHTALKTMKLPCVTLHEASEGVSVEVDYGKPFRSPVDWSRLPVLSVMLISPTRHYVVDPTPLEELALPQQLHVAVNAAGQVSYFRFQQLPSRRGNTLRLATHQGSGVGDAALSPLPTGMSALDITAMLHDAVYICQAVIAECDEALQKVE